VKYMDLIKAEASVRDLLMALGQDCNSEDMKSTPRRVAEMLAEQCTLKDAEIDVTFTEDRFDGMVVVRDIPFVSWCAHHLVPFSGRAHVGYIPKSRVLGLSKLARLVYACSVGFTTQERITDAIAERLFKSDDVNCLGCMVVLEAEHGCMNLRGARAVGSATTTSEVKGVFRDVSAARGEMLSFIMRGGCKK
jgi:GTP cyclohydrolase IA